MEFQKERVYTAVNADELKAGDKVIVADDMLTLKAKVSEGFNWYVVAITSILGEEWYGRFDIDKHNFSLAYLVERAKNCTNCGEGKWDAEHKKILCDPAHCGNGNVVFRDHEIEVCEYWRSINKETEKHTDCNHCEEAREAYACAMTNACPNKHYRPFKDTEELVKEWHKKFGYTDLTGSKLTKPYIWVRSRFNKDHRGVLINNYFGEYVEFGKVQCFLTRLFNEYTFLDGSPCGVEE